MAVNLNLVKADTALGDLPDKRKVNMVDILTENRMHYNAIVDALGLINNELANIKNLSEKVDQNEQKVDNLINVNTQHSQEDRSSSVSHGSQASREN